MHWPVRVSRIAGRSILSIAWAFTLGAAQAFGAPQAPSTSSPPGSLEALEKRVDELSANLETLRAEVKQSREEARVLREQLNAARSELSLLEKAQPLPGSEAPGNGISAGGVQSASLKNESAVHQRLDKLEESEQLLQGKVDEQYQTKVESASKYRVKFSGIALFNLFGNHGSVDNTDLPNLAREKSPLDSSGSVGATVRQSEFGMEVFGPKLGNARTSADVNLDFFGGFPGTVNGITTGLIRIRTARMRLDWDRTSIVVGQDAPFFSPLSPTSLASLAEPALSYAGNLWTWTPQVRIEHRVTVGENSDFEIAGGILDPLTGETPSSQYYRQPQAGERSGQPAYAARLGWGSLAWQKPLSFGLGGYYSRQDWGFARTVDAWAATADWQIPLGRKLGFTGEFYRGRALGGFGAAEGRSILFDGPLAEPSTSVLGLDTAGGWAQLKISPNEKLEFNGAFGEDLPSATDFKRFMNSTSYVASTVSRNQSSFFNFIYHARSNVLFSAEYRKLWTYNKYETKYGADVINLSMGILF